MRHARAGRTVGPGRAIECNPGPGRVDVTERAIERELAGHPIHVQLAVAGESIGEQHPARAELVLGVMRLQSLFTNGLGGDDRSVAVAARRKINDREEVAVLATLVANPRKEITRRSLPRLTG